MHDSEYLYLGIQASPQGVGSVCIDRGDEVAVLHSSAAVGMAVYQIQADGNSWHKTQDFSWCYRGTSSRETDGQERQRQLAENGWLASNAHMGNATEMEYQITITEVPLRLAIAHLQAPEYQSLAYWPEGLKDSCREIQLLTGPLPDELYFSPQFWAQIIPTGESATENTRPD